MRKAQQKSLLNWFKDNRRPLPWRDHSGPYEIWISEVMLQQTTSAAVTPYYLAFLKKFSTIEKLASASLEDVYEMWSGLGYYSRARNLHRAAQIIVNKLGGQFPKSSSDLIQLPGFGPYTSRSVASLAFGESVGVLDGNVIRFLSRYYNKKFKWWEGPVRREMQRLVDQWVCNVPSGEMNQALMELGATICLPQNPKCILCPLMNECAAQKNRTTHAVPIKKPKKNKEIWMWEALVRTSGKNVYLAENNYAPFLKNSPLPEGRAKKLTSQPKKFDFRHTITHHEIYVRIQHKEGRIKSSGGKWVPLAEAKKVAPASLVQKAVRYALDSKN